MYPALGDLEFLTRSETRIGVLGALAQKPQTGDELKDSTDVSRSTISRMLDDFKAKEWVDQDDERYRLTAKGSFIDSEVSRLLDAVDTFDDAQFLSRSSSRVVVLDAVADTPRPRHELRSLTEASRVTINRIVADFEDRGWVVHENGTWAATGQGASVADEFTRVLDNLRTLEHLGEHVNWLRMSRFEFDLCELQDANVITPTWDDFAAYTSTLVDLVYESTDIRAVGTGLHREFLQALSDATLNGELSLDLIYTPAVIHAIESEPDLCRLVRDLSDSERATIYRYGGGDSLMMLLIHETDDPREDVVLLCGQHDEGAPPGTVETTNPRVKSWAEAYFDAVQADARPIDAGALTSGRAGTT